VTEAASNVLLAIIVSFRLTPIHSFSRAVGPFTALLPTNTAFEDLDPAFLENLLLPENLDELVNFLLYHLLPGATLTTDLSEGPTDTLFSGNQLEVGLDPVQFDQVNVTTGDIMACNGYIDIIDGVLSPYTDPICDGFTFGRRVLQNEGKDCDSNVLQTARENPDLEVITSLIETAGLDPIFECAGKWRRIFHMLFCTIQRLIFHFFFPVKVHLLLCFRQILPSKMLTRHF